LKRPAATGLTRQAPARPAALRPAVPSGQCSTNWPRRSLS